MNTTYHSFLFIIPSKFINSAYKVITPYEINVRYAFHWNKKVDVEAYYLPPGLGKIIVRWDELDEQIKLAAENNSKQYLPPGQPGKRGRELEPLELLNLEERQNLKQI